MKTVIFHNLGSIDYKKAWDIQENYFDEIFEAKLSNEKEIPENKLLFCQHPHVYTLGKSGNKNNLLLSEELLKQKNASFYQINRGGDITYHGPGQIVGYPIFNLEDFKMSIKNYVFNIEEIIIEVLKTYGISAGRSEGETGVWLAADDKSRARKIAAIGMRISKMVSMHGFALNVNTNLEYYNYIIPCGITDKGVTSLQKELGKEIDIKEVEEKLLNQFKKVFEIDFSNHP